MKRFGIMTAALAFVLGMAQCRKPVETINAAPTGETVEVTLRVANGAGKTEITPTGVVTWKAGDRLYVVGATDGLLGSVSATAAGDPADFTGKITALTEAQTLKFYYVGGKAFELDGSGNCTFDISGQDGSLAGIAANNQLMYGVTTGSITPGTTDFGTVSMTSVMAIAHLNIHDGGNAVAGPVTVTGGFATSTFNAKTYAGGTLTGTAGDMTMTFATGTTSTGCHMALLPGSQTLTFTTSDGKTKTLAAKTIAANTFYNAGSAVEVAVTPTYLPGEFTVDKSGNKVKFSKGNLQYLGKSDGTGTWRFAEHQWDYMGDGPSSGTTSQGNVDLGTEYTGKYNTGSGSAGGSETADDKASARDLFGWGTTGSQDTRTSSTGYQTNYRPYSTSNTKVGKDHPAYNINRYGYGPDYTGTMYGLTVEKKSDWGCLAIGGDPAGTWRTLSSAEWVWLLGPKDSPTPGTNCRTSSTINGTANARYAEVKVNGVCGMMVFPDEFAWPSDVSSLPSTFNTFSSNWNGVNYTIAEFGKLETFGVVFLPAAGSRYGTSLSYVGSYGYYWSSSCYSSSSAYYMYFSSGNVNPQSYSLRYSGFSVRLVR